jgi:peptidoglycan-associated lipoprotein
MNKLITIVSILVLVSMPACRHRARPVAAPPAAAAQSPAPVVTSVQPPARDFASSQTPKQDAPAIDVAELNRTARQRGWIDDAFFGFDSFVLTPAAQSALSKSAQWLRDHPDHAVHIEGHCDERGTEQYNLALGDRRANGARTYLIGLGVDGDRLTTVSYGEERPFADGHDEEAWSQNRRAHVILGSRLQKPPM